MTNAMYIYDKKSTTIVYKMHCFDVCRCLCVCKCAWLFQFIFIILFYTLICKCLYVRLCYGTEKPVKFSKTIHRKKDNLVIIVLVLVLFCSSIGVGVVRPAT